MPLLKLASKLVNIIISAIMPVRTNIDLKHIILLNGTFFIVNLFMAFIYLLVAFNVNK